MQKAETVKGFEKLSLTNQKMFQEFLDNFYCRQGIDARKTIIPQTVAMRSDKSNGSYLRFDYLVNGRATWLHVKSPTTWY